MKKINKSSSIQRNYDLNGILQLANIAIVLLTLFLYYQSDDNIYIDNYTIATFLVFGFQNGLILLWEKKSREPLIMLLMLTVIPFYMLRIATLLYEPWSVVLIRFPFSPENMNHALLFIMFCVLSMTIGIKIVAKRGDFRRNTQNLDLNVDKTPNRLFFLMLFTTSLDLLSVLGIKVFGAVQGFVSIIFNADLVLILLLAVYATKGEHISKRQKYSYLALFAFFVAVRTFSGSRSALLTMALSVLFISFSLYQKVTIKKHVIVLLVAMLPLAAIGFSITTYWRPYQIAKIQGLTDVTPGNFIIDYSKNVTGDSFKESLKLVLRPMFDRAGYLDMAAEIITNAEKYSVIINPVYYFKSVIDNVLTPVYDVYNVPKVANNTISVYNGMPLLNRSDVSTFYQSDMLTIFGEYYAMLGGYIAIPCFFVMGFFSKLLFEAISLKNDVWNYSCRAIYFKIYILWLWSFGLDWLIGDLVFMLISVVSLYVISVVKLPKIVCTSKGSWRKGVPLAKHN